MIAKFLKGLTDTADTIPIRQAPDDSGNQKRYYVEFTGRAADGSVDTLAGGTMKIEGKLHGEGGWEVIEASVDLTTADQIFVKFLGAYHTLRFTPDSVEADHSVDVFVLAVDAGASEEITATVDSVSLDAGENHLGAVGGHAVVVEASITRPANTTPYTAGDAVTNSESAPDDTEFTGCARVNDGSGVILAAELVDSVNASPDDFDLLLFDTAPTPNNDNEALALSDADALNILPGGVISFAQADHGIDLGSNTYTWTVRNLNIPFECTGGGTTLFGLLVVRGAYTPASAEVFTMRLGIAQD